MAREIMDAAGGAKPDGMSTRQAAAAAVAYKGMTTAELAAVVEDFKASQAWGFTGMTRGEAWYRPMLCVYPADCTDFSNSGMGVISLPPSPIVKTI